MKICISGAQSTGKTTLVNSLKDKLEDFKFVTNITRSLKEKGFKINEDGDDSTQLNIQKIHTENLKLDGNVVYDRSLLDGLVYTHYLFLNGKVSEETLKKVKKLFESSFYKYDLFCYIKPEFDIVEDNVRSTDVLFRNTIVHLFDYYIDKYKLKPLVIKGNVEQRVEQILKYKPYFDLKVDLHRHLGRLEKNYSAKSNSRFFYIDADHNSEDINYNNLTDAVMLYSNYDLMEELSNKTNCRLYGLQYIDDPISQKLDINKPLFKGLKLHNTRHTVPYNYSDKIIQNMLEKLPDSSIILYHTGCVDDIINISSLATKFPKLKHIIGHSGSFGFLTQKPSSAKSKDVNNRYISCNAAMEASILCANLLPNVFLDTACYFVNKAWYLSKSFKFAIGTDFDLINLTYEFNHKQLIRKTGNSGFLMNYLGYKFLNESVEEFNISLRDIENNFMKGDK